MATVSADAEAAIADEWYVVKAGGIGEACSDAAYEVCDVSSVCVGVGKYGNEDVSGNGSGEKFSESASCKSVAISETSEYESTARSNYKSVETGAGSTDGVVYAAWDAVDNESV